MIGDHNKKRIVVVAPYFYPYLGGLENYAYNTAKLLNESGEYSVSVITTNHEAKKYKEEVISGMKIYRLPIWFKLSNTPINPLWYFQVKKIFKKEKPDIIHAHTPVPFVADMAQRARGNIPFVLTYHNDFVKPGFLLNTLGKLVYFFLMSTTLRRANVVVATSQYYADNSPYLRKYKEKVAIVPPGVDLGTFHESVDKLWLKQKYGENYTILFVGQLSKTHAHKGVSILLDAVAELKKRGRDVSVVLVGEGDAVPDYKQEAEKRAIKNIFFTGRVSDPELAKHYAGADVIILPTTTNSEGFGMVLMEGAASGTPGIGSNIGGISQAIVDRKTGILVKPSDFLSLADAIEKLITTPDLARQMGTIAAKRVREEFSWNMQAEKYGTLFSEVLSQKPLIAQVTGYYPPHTGGLEVVAEEVSKELARQSFPVKVFTSTIGAGNMPRRETAKNYCVRRLRAVEVAHTPLIFSLLPRLLFLPKRTILHVHVAQAGILETAFLAAKIRKFPIVAHFHLDVGPSGSLGFLLPLYKKYILGFVLRRVDKVIVFSREQVEFLQKKYRIRKDRIAIVPNGVKEDFFMRDIREVLGPKEKLELLFVGRLAAQKRVDRIIDALALTKIPCHLTIVGEGEKREELEAQARALNLTNISFVGKKVGHELVEYYKNADVFVISSDVEGMPLVVLEAFAAGLPVLSSNVMGLRELVRGVGTLVEDSTPAGFAREITRLWENPALLRELSKKSRDKAEDLSWIRVVERVKGIYSEFQNTKNFPSPRKDQTLKNF